MNGELLKRSEWALLVVGAIVLVALVAIVRQAVPERTVEMQAIHAPR